jgi:hypothetical protein
VLALVRRARRRLFYNELFTQGANTSSAALGAFILLLLLGTEVLSWQVALLIPIAALAAGLYIARRRLPSPYAAAQTIDRRLGLADTLSTALFFSDSRNSARISPDVIRLQAESAERLSQSVDVRRAIPYTVPRTIYAMAALLLVAGSLFALRYGVSRRLDLKQPLATMLHQTFGAETPEQAARSKMPKVPRPDIAPDSDMASAEQREQRAGDPQDDASQQGEEATDPASGKSESKNADGSAKSPQNGEESKGEQQEASSDDGGDESNDASSGQQGNNKQDSKEGNSKQDANSSGENNSLMSKVKDAVQNLLSRMKPQQNQSGGQQQAGEQNSQQGKGQQKGGKQESAKNGQQQGGNQQSDSQDGQAGEQSQDAQDQQGKGTGNSDAKQASKQPGSGVGSQDGEKRLKAAEQLAAMGKISEIIGKRSQTISGETTVEVQSTSQQLHTQYSNRAVQHTQAGAEISRDEIPVALQTYVEHYFEQVRKQPVAAKPEPAKK